MRVMSMQITFYKNINGKKVSVTKEEMLKPKKITEEQRLANYKGDRQEIDKEKRGL